MLHCCTSRRLLVLAGALGFTGLWLGYSRSGLSQQWRWPGKETELRRAKVEAAMFAATYRIEEGRASSREVEVPSEPITGAPGKVDTLNINQAYERAYRLLAQTQGKVFKATITPNWFDDNKRFWYRNDLSNGRKEFILVDTETGKRGPAFDHERLATALSKTLDAAHKPDRLPFARIELTDGLKAVLFEVGGTNWQCNLENYECSRATRAPKQEAPPQEEEEPLTPFIEDEDTPPVPEDLAPQQKKGFGKGKKQGGVPPNFPLREARSPNGAWTAFIKDNNVHLRDKEGKETAVTTNGVAENAYSAVTWSPDSKTVVAFRTEPGDNKQVYLIESSPRDQLPAKFSQRAYPRPGDKFALHEVWVIGLEMKQPTKVDVERIDFGRPGRLRWSKDAKTFTFEKTDRGHQRFRVIEVETATGKTRNIIDEKTDTFIWTAHAPSGGIMGVSVQYLDKTNEILYVSQRDGWKHMYLIDATDGKIKNQITKGDWVVRTIDRVDEDARQIWFRASGKNRDQDPYFIHYYRVNFDGTGLVAMTEGDGNHRIEYSPDRKHIIDTYSRVDMAPVHDLRRVSDGKLVCKLDDADISALLSTGWKAPEVFVAKGRDGRTDIWGIVCRPQNYDPGKKYPVIEYIYAGPHDSFVPKTFTAYRQMQSLAELGFIVVQCDGMGTANRSKAFHDVCWKNLADAGFPDRILWMKALAQKYAYVDISRVGIYGTSAGGQSSTAGVLFHPEFYKVAVSSCGCHDNRLDKSSWNEQWMGLLGPHYEKQSNVTNAHKLVGKLLLIVGELDTNVPPESTLRVVDALIRARKDFDLIFVPGMGHSGGGTYGDRRRWDYFVRHLHGIEPPDRNAPTAVRAGEE